MSLRVSYLTRHIHAYNLEQAKHQLESGHSGKRGSAKSNGIYYLGMYVPKQKQTRLENQHRLAWECLH